MDRANFGFASGTVFVPLILGGALVLGTASPSFAQSQGMPGPQIYTPPPLIRPTPHYATPRGPEYRGLGHYGHGYHGLGRHRQARGRVRR
jgi:hypothetical protein